MTADEPDNPENFRRLPMPTRQCHNHNREHEQGRGWSRVREDLLDKKRGFEATRVAHAVAALQPNRQSASGVGQRSVIYLVNGLEIGLMIQGPRLVFATIYCSYPEVVLTHGTVLVSSFPVSKIQLFPSQKICWREEERQQTMMKDNGERRWSCKY